MQQNEAAFQRLGRTERERDIDSEIEREKAGMSVLAVGGEG